MRNERLAEVGERLRGKVRDLENMCPQIDPWVFLCAAAFIDYLARLAYGDSLGGDRRRYPAFIRRFFPAGYREFRYTKGSIADLPEQMYHILRCGIVHSFSFVPEDRPGEPVAGRAGSVVIGHRSGGGTHLRCYPSEDGYGHALLLAEDFVKDIGLAVDAMLRKATPRTQLERLMIEWADKYPMIGPVKL